MFKPCVFSAAGDGGVLQFGYAAASCLACGCSGLACRGARIDQVQPGTRGHAARDDPVRLGHEHEILGVLRTADELDVAGRRAAVILCMRRAHESHNRNNDCSQVCHGVCLVGFLALYARTLAHASPRSSADYARLRCLAAHRPTVRESRHRNAATQPSTGQSHEPSELGSRARDSRRHRRHRGPAL